MISLMINYKQISPLWTRYCIGTLTRNSWIRYTDQVD